jgi:hypothetical protein
MPGKARGRVHSRIFNLGSPTDNVVKRQYLALVSRIAQKIVSPLRGLCLIRCPFLASIVPKIALQRYIRRCRGRTVSADQNIKQHLQGAIESLHKVVDFSMRVSLRLRGTPATDQSELASIVHAKMCINGASAGHMLRSTLTDHSVIIGICRMIMEASILFQYLMENISAEEWKCRVLCLKLHDTVNRIKLMRGFQRREEYDDLRRGRDELLKELQESPFFKTLPAERANLLLTGEHFYLRGVNSAVKNSAWNADKYMAYYSYFSAHAHSAPMSFFRFKQHNVRFSDPSEAQQATMVTALSVAEYSLLKATFGHLNSTPQVRTEFDSKELAELERSLVSWKKHFES